VIRGSHLGESHGGLYLVDLERGSAELKLDWNTTNIDIAGRGGDRGLRGIAYDGEHILVAANAELLILDRNFTVLESYGNPYLQHCHEISVAAGRVLLTSTGFDSVLMFDLRTRRFTGAWQLAARDNTLELRPFVPSLEPGPANPVGPAGSAGSPASASAAGSAHQASQAGAESGSSPRAAAGSSPAVPTPINRFTSTPSPQRRPGSGSAACAPPACCTRMRTACPWPPNCPRAPTTPRCWVRV
jgi:hypothetical protein